MESPVEEVLHRFCQAQGLELSSQGLIENDTALTLSEARKHMPSLIFRWTNRICDGCGKQFNITNHGIFYNCQRC